MIAQEFIHDWGAILPEILLASAALLLLALEVVVPSTKRVLPHLAIWVQVVLGLWLGYRCFFGEAIDGVIFAFSPIDYNDVGMLQHNAQTDLVRCFFLFCGVVVCHLGMTFLKSRTLARVEFFHIVLLIVACFMLLVQSAHFAMLFVALETLTIGFYVLVGYARGSKFSLEAALKYVVAGALSSGVMLFGMVLLFGAASNPLLPGSSTDPLQFGDLGRFLAAQNGDVPLIAMIGAGLVLGGVAFKIGLVPFQIWIPDVYQGAPTPVTAFLAVASKAAGVLVLLNLLQGPFAELSAFTIPVLSLLTGATLIFGNIAALPQRNVKRLMGLSGVSHAGILMLGVLASQSQPWLVPVVFFYLFVYALASFGVFEVMSHVGPAEDADQEFEDYSELIQQQPLLGGALVIGLGSLAGIPPLAGFIAKVLIFYGAFQAELYGLMALALFGVVLSIYYYFGWIRSSVTKSLFPDESRGEPRSPLFGARVMLFGLSGLSVFFGLYQGFFHLG